MAKSSERVDVVVLSSTGVVRALVSAGLSIPHAQAAARLFMPYLQAQEQADLRIFTPTQRSRTTWKQIARKRASAILSMSDKELDRLCVRAESEMLTQTVRRGTGVALLDILRAEHQAHKSRTTGVHQLLLSPNMRVVDTET